VIIILYSNWHFALRSEYWGRRRVHEQAMEIRNALVVGTDIWDQKYS